MKFKNLLSAVTFMLLIVLLTNNMLSQEAKTKGPLDGDAGVGFVVGGEGYFGLTGVYVINSDLHLGVNLGFYYDNNGDFKNGSSNTNFVFAPYARMFLKPIKSFRPFIEAQFSILNGKKNEMNTQNASQIDKIPLNRTAIHIAVGGQWFPITTVGIYGGFDFFQYILDPVSNFKIGLQQPFIGIEWYVF